MRISDWSSDVCSSDLADHPVAGLDRLAADWASRLRGEEQSPWLLVTSLGGGAAAGAVMVAVSLMLLRAGEGRVLLAQWRSEERRVGKECVSTGRSRWSQDHEKNNIIKKKSNDH